MKPLVLLPIVACLLKCTMAFTAELFISVGELTFYSCCNAISNLALITDSDYPETLYYGAFCEVDNPAALGSVSTCIIDNFPKHPDRTEQGIRYILKYCKAFNLTLDQVSEAYNNATDYLVSIEEIPNFNSTERISYPIRISDTYMDVMYKTYIGFNLNYGWSDIFGFVLMGYWFFVIGIAGLCNLARFVAPNFINSTFNGPISRWYRRYVSLPATFSQAHATPAGFKWCTWLVPTRLETILLVIWLILAVPFNCVHINHVTGTLFFNGKPAEISREIGDRSGIISIYLIPVNILLAGRNNFLQWVSGWDRSRMLTLHRWTSRLMFILVALHSIGMAMTFSYSGIYAASNQETYVIWGYVGTIAGTILLLQSFLKLRTHNYELFLLGHILFAAIFIAAGWLHVVELGYVNWYIAAVAVWVYDRVVRVFRLAFFGVRKARVELRSNEVIKVTVPCPKYWKPFPGCHAYIHFLRPTCFWQSHPFTLLSCEKENGETEISMYIKVKGGMTHGLYKFLAQQPDQTSIINVMVEGPYGERAPFDRYNNAIFIASGNGIPGLYTEAMSLVKRNVEATKSIKFYWIVRDWKMVSMFMDEMINFKDTKIETIVYLTQPEPNSNSEENETENKIKNEDEKVSANTSIDDVRRSLSFVEFRKGRPIFEILIKENISESEGTKGFFACAHPFVVDEIRYFVGENLHLSKDRVDYFEQIQIW